MATNAAGEILVAASLNHGAGSGVDDIRAAIAPSISGAWPDIALVSPAGTTANLYRDPIVAGGGTSFSVGWGVHGAGNQRTEVISTKPAGATCGGAPTPTATATASPAPSPIRFPCRHRRRPRPRPRPRTEEPGGTVT